MRSQQTPYAVPIRCLVPALVLATVGCAERSRDVGIENASDETASMGGAGPSGSNGASGGQPGGQGGEAATGGNGGSSCPEGAVHGDVVVTTNEDVRALEGCREIEGNLFIESRLVSDLSPLHALERIGFGLHMSWMDGLDDDEPGESRLESLAGLEGLRSVLALSVSDNDALTDISALSGLEEIDRSLYLTNNAALRSLQGLEGLRRVGTLGISNNDALADISALSRLEEITREDLFVANNAALRSLEGLHNVSEVPRILEISGNARLEDLNGLRGLRSIGGTLYITENQILEDLAGLHGLGSVGDRLVITGNRALSSIVGISGFDAVEQINIARNDALVELDVPVVGTSRSVFIERNASLERLTAPASFSVSDQVVIILNPALPGEYAAEWARQIAGGDATLKVDGNLGDPPNGSDCPWTDDYTCDEPDLCATGSDVADCEMAWVE